MTEKKIYLSKPAQAVNKYLVDMTEKEHGVGTKYKAELSALRNSANRSVEADTLIENVARRFSGVFWTPKIWVDKAHEMISEQLGSDWKEKYTVWDCASGALNLTRDYSFEKLYSSTLFEEELAIAEDYNKESVKFQYDFLNDDVDMNMLSREDFEKDDSLFSSFKIPEQLLRDMYENKPIVFFSNPPYGQATGWDDSAKSGIADTSIQTMMKGMGWAQKELYTQFIYRVQLFAEMFNYKKDFNIFFFTSSKFIPSASFEKFTNKLTKQFEFKSGFLMNAGEFSGTSSTWGIIFSHWHIGGTSQKTFEFDILISNKDKTKITEKGKWIAKIVPKEKFILRWLKEIDIPSKELNEGNYPRTTNGLDKTVLKKPRGKLREGAIGFAAQSSSNIQATEKYVSTYTTIIYRGQAGCTITKENFLRAAVTFSIRRGIYENINSQGLIWAQWEDIFQAPSHKILTDEFYSDCLIYSLFERKASQTSLRDFENNGNKYRINNEFFPFSKDFIKELAVKHNNTEIQSDLNNDSDRLVYNYLNKNKEHISPEAQAVLDEAKSLIKDSFALRDVYAMTKPRYQTNSWDAGWLQINRMIFGQDRFNDDLIHRKEAWQEKVRTLGDKIAQASYDDGIISPPYVENTENIELDVDIERIENLVDSEHLDIANIVHDEDIENSKNEHFTTV